MGNFIRSLSSLMSGRSDAVPPEGKPDAPVPISPGNPPAEAAQPALPLVAYAVTHEEMASSRLRRPRSVGLLRSASTAVATTTSRVLPAVPTVATRHPQVHPSRPVLTETERVRLQVMQAQIQLASLRLYEGPIDGVMTPATITAVRYFQTLKGMRATGQLAAGTLTALGVPPLD